jgi:GGDEF domain-containing protein
MNGLDPTTLFAVAGLITIVCGAYFLLETLLRRNDLVGRLWSVFFIAAMFVVFSYIVSALDPGMWWAQAPANGGYVVAVGMLWSGARAANERRALVLVPLSAGAVVAVATLLPGVEGGYWAGSLEMFLGIAVFAGLGAWELGRSQLGRMQSARILSVMLAAVAVFYLARAAGLVFLGPDSPVFETYLGTAASTIFELCLSVIGTVSLSSVQAERFTRSSGGPLDTRDGVRPDGILGPQAFREFAESWLLRSVRERVTLVFLVVEIADLEEINIAFGRAAGDSAIRLTARLMVTNAPAASLIGQLSARRFAVLTSFPTTDSIEGVAHRIGDAVLDATVDERDRFRVTTFHGIATTRTSGSRYDDLLQAATEAVALDSAATREKATAETEDPASTLSQP